MTACWEKVLGNGNGVRLIFSTQEENPDTVMALPFWPSGPLLSIAGSPGAADYLTLMPIGSFGVAPAR